MDLKRLSVERGYEALANTIREQILDGRIAPGQALPNERDLHERSGLSRGSVREAMRTLEAQGLVVTSLGRYGGRIVVGSRPELLDGPLDLLIRGAKVPFGRLLETIEILEPSLAGLAALHRTAADLDRIAGIATTMEATTEPAAFHDLNAEWHIAIAEGSGNRILAAVLGAVGKRLHDPHVKGFASGDVRTAVIRAHAAIEAAIRDGDAEAARRRMLRHVVAYRARIEQIAPSLIDF